jgi:hypothetical protein
MDLMKRIAAVLLMIVCTLPLLCGCTSLRTYMLDDNLPHVLDEYTLLPLIESVKITRQSDGATVVLTGTDVDKLMLCFENIVCTRKKSPPPAASYVVEFIMADKTDARPPLMIGGVKNSRAAVFGIGEYYYESVNMKMYVTYLEQLF